MRLLTDLEFALLLILLNVDFTLSGGSSGRSGSRRGMGTPASRAQAERSKSLSKPGGRFGWSYKSVSTQVKVRGYVSYTNRVKGDSFTNDPTVCYNEKRMVTSYNSTTNTNSTEPLGYYVCPYDGDSTDAIYCCGDDKEQRCCDDEPYSYFNLLWLVILTPVVFIIAYCSWVRHSRCREDLRYCCGCCDNERVPRVSCGVEASSEKSPQQNTELYLSEID